MKHALKTLLIFTLVMIISATLVSCQKRQKVLFINFIEEQEQQVQIVEKKVAVPVEIRTVEEVVKEIPVEVEKIVEVPVEIETVVDNPEDKAYISELESKVKELSETVANTESSLTALSVEYEEYRSTTETTITKMTSELKAANEELVDYREQQAVEAEKTEAFEKSIENYSEKAKEIERVQTEKYFVKEIVAPAAEGAKKHNIFFNVGASYKQPFRMNKLDIVNFREHVPFEHPVYSASLELLFVPTKLTENGKLNMGYKILFEPGVTFKTDNFYMLFDNLFNKVYGQGITQTLPIEEDKEFPFAVSFMFVFDIKTSPTFALDISVGPSMVYGHGLNPDKIDQSFDYDALPDVLKANHPIPGLAGGINARYITSINHFFDFGLSFNKLFSAKYVGTERGEGKCDTFTFKVGYGWCL